MFSSNPVVPPIQQWTIDSHNPPIINPSGASTTTHYHSNGNSHRYPSMNQVSLPQIPHPAGVGANIASSESSLRGLPTSVLPSMLPNAFSQGRPTSVSPVVSRPSPAGLVINPDGDGGNKN